MDALILSCSTGGGHNAAGQAIMEELESRGHHVEMFDPYILTGGNLDRIVGNGYIKIAQNTPRLFGAVYKLGDEYRRLPIHSPVYALNKLMLKKMQAYLQEHHFDVVFMPHVFPGEILTYMKSRGIAVPRMIFISTDYACIPFTEETDCDYYIIPAKELAQDYIRRGIPEEKLIPAGIPVKRAFRENLTREEAADALGLDKDKRYLLLSGGSIGAGLIGETINALCRYLRAHPDYRLIAICGSNEKLLNRLTSEYGGNQQVILLTSTEKMALYMKLCDVFLSKPGGLSSTEAAVTGTPLIHISPIPGCETLNMRFFEQCGMSIAVGRYVEQLPKSLERLRSPYFSARMIENQRAHINPNAAAEICDLAERTVKESVLTSNA